MQHLPPFPLPAHTCYIELCAEDSAFERGLHRIFTKKTSSIEVLNEDGALSRLFRAVRDCPQALVEALHETGPVEPELARVCQTAKTVLATWHITRSLGEDAEAASHVSPLPRSIEELHAMLLPPYRRLRWVMGEALDWQTCQKRYDRRGALQLIDLPQGRDLMKTQDLIRPLSTSQCSWILRVPQEMSTDVWEMIDGMRLSMYECAENVSWFMYCLP